MDPLTNREQTKLQAEIARQEKQEKQAGQQKLVREGQLQKQHRVSCAGLQSQLNVKKRAHNGTAACSGSRKCFDINKAKATGSLKSNPHQPSTPLPSNSRILLHTYVAYKRRDRNMVCCVVLAAASRQISRADSPFPCRYLQNRSTCPAEHSKWLGKRHVQHDDLLS